jgi:integrase
MAYRVYQDACAKVGYPDLRFHDLRHLTAINLIRAGLDLVSIKTTLGHASLQSTMRYAEHADDTAASRAASLLDRLRGQ